MWEQFKLDNSDGKQFFMIWSPQGNMPRVQHQTFEAAKKEAERLANISPDRQFYILVAIEKVFVQKTITESLSGDFCAAPF